MHRVYSALVALLIILSPLPAQRAVATPVSRRASQGLGGIQVTQTNDDALTLQQINDAGFCKSPSVSDCSVRSAFTVALDSGGGVYIPAGQYALLNGSLIINQPSVGKHLTMTGDGMDQTILIGAGDRLLTINSLAAQSEIILQGLTFRGGSTAGIGGAILTNAPTTLDGVRLQENRANNSGGGIGVWQEGRLTIRNSEVLSNTAGFGGGVATYEATTSLDMANTLVAYNVAGNQGAGVDTVGPATIDHSTIRDNRSYGAGGGLRALSSITVSDSVIADNRSSNHSGGATVGNSSAMVGITMTARFVNTTISGNQDSNTYGGGLSVLNNATAVVVNSTISGNSAPIKGGGIYNEAIVELYNSSVVGNSAPSGAGIKQVYSVYTPNSRTTLRNSVVAYNGSSSGLGDCSGTLQGGAYNFVQTVVAGECSAVETMTGVDPLLGPLQDNGGLTLTHLPDATSPLVNAGNPSGCFGGTAVLTLDQRGQPRPSGGGRCDIGAVEVQNCVTPAVPDDVLAQRAGNNLILSWTAAGADLYEVWWDTEQSYFTPGASCAALPGACATTTIPTYTLVNALAGSAPFSYSYILVGRNSCGVAASTHSNRVGTFAYSLMP